MDWQSACQKSPSKQAYRYEIRFTAIPPPALYVKHFIRSGNNSCMTTNQEGRFRRAFQFEMEGFDNWIPIEEAPTDQELMEEMNTILGAKIKNANRFNVSTIPL